MRHSKDTCEKSALEQFIGLCATLRVSRPGDLNSLHHTTIALNVTLLNLTMDVVEKTNPRVEVAMMIIHDDGGEILVTPRSESQGEQDGVQTMVDEIGPPVFKEEVKSSLCTPQNDEVSQVVGTASIEASPRALRKAGALVTEEKALPVMNLQEEETPACNMRLESDYSATEGGESDIVQTESGDIKFAGCSRIKRKYSCSEEASVDVHSDDSDTTVSVVDHPILQKNSEEFAGVAHGDQTEPTLAEKWTHEVSVDVFIPDGWVEVEIHSAAEPETSNADTASYFVEPVNRNLTTEHEAPSATEAGELENRACAKRMDTIELEKRGRELISQSLGIQKPVTRMEREVASPNSIGTQTMNLPEQTLLGSVEQESSHSNQCETVSLGLQVLPIQVGEAPKNDVPTFTQDEDRDLEVCLLPTSGEAGESMAWEFTSTQVERVDVVESTPCTSENLVVADGELTCEGIIDVDSYQGERHVEGTGRVPSFADQERVIAVDARTTDVTMVEVLEISSAPPKQSESTADIGELDQRIWSLKNLKKRPLMAETRAVTEQSVRVVKPKPPKVVGISWPPMPLIDAQDKHCVNMEDAFTSPRQQSVGATGTIVAEANYEVVLESESSPLEQPEGVEGAEANIEKKNLQGVWSLENLKKRTSMVETRAVKEQSIRLVKPRAPKFVGLSWPPMPLIDAQDKHCVDTDDGFTSPRQRAPESVGVTDTIVAEVNQVVLESASSPLEQPEGVEGAEANIEEKNLQRIWSLKHLKTRPLLVDARTVTEQSIRVVKPKPPKVVGLSWPPTPLTAAQDKHCVNMEDTFTSPRQESVGATGTIVAEANYEVVLSSESSPSLQPGGFEGAEANIKEKNLQGIWSLQNLKERPLMVETRTVTEQSIRLVKPKAPKVVGLAWPPAPLTMAPGITGVFT